MQSNICVIGGANLDISAALENPFIANDSNMGRVTLGHGGVARNIAHNLSLLGHSVSFISVFGNDMFGSIMSDHCKHIGLNIDMCEHVKDHRTGIYLCINNHAGDMIAAVADTDVITHISPTFIEHRLGIINQADFVVADANLSEETIAYLLSNAVAPIFIDAVSSTKAWRVVNALRQSDNSHLHTLKLNQKEALAVTETQTPQEAANSLIDMGVDYVYITLGSEGVFCASADQKTTFPALPVEVINTTGAGDAFLAGVVHAETQEIAFPQTAQYGLMAARATLLSEQAVNTDIANILL